MATGKTMVQRKLQPSTFAFEARPMSTESYGTTRERFLTQPLPDYSEKEDDLYAPPQVYKPVEQKKKKKKKKLEKFDPNLDDREEARLQELKEWLNSDADKQELHHLLKIAMLKHMRVLDDLEKLRAHYYLEYMDALTDKVESQRKDIQRRSELHRQKLQKKENRKKEAAQHAKMHMHRQEISTDNSFLRGLKKTKYHKIVVLQDKLMREGKLWTDEEVRAFWEDIVKPENYHMMFGEEETIADVGTSVRTKPKRGGELLSGDLDSEGSGSILDHKSSTLGSLHPLDQLPPGLEALAQIQEVNELSRPSSVGGSNVQAWMAVSKLKKKVSQPQLMRKPVHPKVLEMEQKCPRVEFPQLAAFTLDLEPPKEDPELEFMREEFRTRARIRNSESRRIRKMYETSLTHGAATKRIFDKKQELSALLDGPTLGDVLFKQRSDCTALVRVPDDDERMPLPPPEIITTAVSETNDGDDTGSNPGRHISSDGDEGDRVEEDKDKEEDEEEEEKRYIYYSSRSSSRQSSASSSSSHRRRNKPVIVEPPKPAPLTMEAAMDKATVKVINCPSALWTNYAKFLPSLK